MLRLLILIFVIGSGAIQASTPPLRFRVCIEENPSFFLWNKAGTEHSQTPGLLIDFFKSLQDSLLLRVEFVRRPARACGLMLKSGEVEAYALLSFKPDRSELGVFPPMREGRPDPNLAFLRGGYDLWVRSDSLLTWDGQNLANLRSWRIGTIEGYAVIDTLREAQINVETSRSLTGMMRRLQRKDLDAIAIHDQRIDRIGEKYQLKKLPHRLRETDYFILIARDFFAKHATLSERIWDLSASYLKSPEGRKAKAKYDSLDSF